MPDPFIRVTGIAAPLPMENVDTDMIWPAIPGAPLVRGAQAKQAFHHLRFLPDGTERNDFVLNRRPWRKAKILVAGDNFGCGSSREMAVWALAEWGLRCIIAPRFGDIFFNNCILNGILPIRLSHADVDRLMALASAPETATMTIDLENCRIDATEYETEFAIEQRARECLLAGLDAIGMTLTASSRIKAFGKLYMADHPWAGSLDQQLLANSDQK